MRRRKSPASAVALALLLTGGCGDRAAGPPEPLPGEARLLDASDPCPRSARLETGPDTSPLYRSIAPFEHHDIERRR